MALATLMPMRKPVNDPGPRATATAWRSPAARPVRSKSQSMDGMSRCECSVALVNVMLPSISRGVSNATLPVVPDDSMARTNGGVMEVTSLK